MTKATKTKTNVKALTQSELDKYVSKSDAIRQLNAKGHTRAEIAKMLNIRYQHVRNVLITPLMSEEKKKRSGKS